MPRIYALANLPRFSVLTEGLLDDLYTATGPGLAEVTVTAQGRSLALRQVEAETLYLCSTTPRLTRSVTVRRVDGRWVPLVRTIRRAGSDEQEVHRPVQLSSRGRVEVLDPVGLDQLVGWTQGWLRVLERVGLLRYPRAMAKRRG